MANECDARLKLTRGAEKQEMLMQHKAFLLPALYMCTGKLLEEEVTRDRPKFRNLALLNDVVKVELPHNNA